MLQTSLDSGLQQRALARSGPVRPASDHISTSMTTREMRQWRDPPTDGPTKGLSALGVVQSAPSLELNVYSSAPFRNISSSKRPTMLR
jgi:hypothetical protein